MTVKLIQRQVLTSGTALVQFVSIPATFLELLLVISARSESVDVTSLNITINSLTSGYASRNLLGQGNGTVISQGGSSANLHVEGGMVSAVSDAGVFSNAELIFPNYTEAIDKSIMAMGVDERNAAPDYWSGFHDALNTTASPISSIEIRNGDGSGNLAAGSSFALYGIS